MIYRILIRIFDFKLQRAWRKGYLLAFKLVLDLGERSKDLKELLDKISHLRQDNIESSVSDDIFVRDLFEKETLINERRSIKRSHRKDI